MWLVSSPLSARRALQFFVLWALSLFVFGRPLAAIVDVATQDERSSYILVIPAIAALVVYLKRKSIFRETRYSPRPALLLLVPALVFYFLLQTRVLLPTLAFRLHFVMLSILTVWIAAFILCYGTKALHEALFPLCFLFLSIPLPPAVLEALSVALQQGTAAMSYGLFAFMGVPVLRQGFDFALPGVDIEVARQCSGLRSGVSFFISTVLAGQFFLQLPSRKVCLGLLAVPVIIFKNALRIVTIAWLGTRVNSAFFHGALHRYGGLVFSVLGLAILVPLILLLQKTESGGPGILPNHHYMEPGANGQPIL